MMLHHPKRILLIEKWSRWLAWLAVFSGGISIIVLVLVKSGAPAEAFPIYSYGKTFAAQANSILFYLQPLASTLASFLMLMGVSLVTRLLRMYLEALEAS
jgi:hypothetical protein